jgi:hypothetical protein
VSTHNKAGKEKQTFFWLQRRWVHECSDSVRTIISKVVSLKSGDTLGVLFVTSFFFSISSDCTDEITKSEPPTFQKLNRLLWKTQRITSVISGFHRNVDEIWALLGYYAASSCNPLPTFRNNLWDPIFKGQEGTLNMGPDTLSRNVNKGLQLDPA